MSTSDPFDDYNRHLLPLPDSTLRDLARNECATREYRKFAVEILLSRKSPYTKHEDLREFVQELEAELDGIQFEFPAPSDGNAESAGTPSASVTTVTMFGQEDVIDNTDPFVKDEPNAP